MEKLNINYMQKFIEDRGRLKSHNVSVKYCDDESPYLSINSVPVLFSFASYLKFQLQCDKSRKCDVFVRGHTKDHKHLIPSLFRNSDTVENCHETYFRAYQKLVSNIQSICRQDRFQDEIGPLLQHYGFKSPWIDVVDNIYTALWFAQHKYDHNSGKPFYTKNNQAGWLTFVATKNKYGEELETRNLRSKHSSLSLRIATQHGYSMISKELLIENQFNEEIKLDSFVIAKVKLPCNNFFDMENSFMSVKNMFPIEEFDNTAKVLSSINIPPICEEVEKEFNLHKGSLGGYERPTSG